MAADDTVTLTIPREALTVVAPPPTFVHQRNVAAVIGLPPRQYLDLCRRGAWPVVAEGKLRLARRWWWGSSTRPAASTAPTTPCATRGPPGWRRGDAC